MGLLENKIPTTTTGFLMRFIVRFHLKVYNVGASSVFEETHVLLECLIPVYPA